MIILFVFVLFLKRNSFHWITYTQNTDNLSDSLARSPIAQIESKKESFNSQNESEFEIFDDHDESSCNTDEESQVELKQGG